jgi:hypothetical protein
MGVTLPIAISHLIVLFSSLNNLQILRKKKERAIAGSIFKVFDYVSIYIEVHQNIWFVM